MSDIFPVPDQDVLQEMHRKQVAERTRQIMEQAAKQLPELMKEKPELTRLGYMILFGHRLIEWAAIEASSVKGMTAPMLQILVEAQRAASQQNFNFPELFEDFRKNQLKWLDTKLRELEARKRTRERRIKTLVERLRRKDILLPFHSLVAPFGEDGFRHGDILTLVGPPRLLELVIRLCTYEYQRAGGTAALLTTAPAVPSRIARVRLLPDQWESAGGIYAELMAVLDPLVRGTLQRPIGLLGVADLTHLMSVGENEMPLVALIRAFALLKQYQQNKGLAIVVGVPIGIHGELGDFAQLNVMAQERVVSLGVVESKLKAGSMNAVIGNDVEPLEALEKRLRIAEEEKE